MHVFISKEVRKHSHKRKFRSGKKRTRAFQCCRNKKVLTEVWGCQRYPNNEMDKVVIIFFKGY